MDYSEMLRNKNVLITGAGGFIGKNLSNKLRDSGVNLTLLYSKKKNINSNEVKYSIDISKEIDIPLKKYDVVFHLAAITNLEECKKNPLNCFNINTNGTLRVLDYFKKSGSSKFIYVSTLGVYGEPTKYPQSENDFTKPTEPYAASKLSAESLVHGLCNSSNINYSIARLFNVYGPGQNKNFVIPKIIMNAINKKKVRLKEISSSRDFIFIDDAIDGLLSLAQTKSGEVYNIGTGKETRISELIKIIEINLKTKVDIEVQKTINSKSIVSRSLADISKIRNEIGWSPKVDLINGLNKTIQYHNERI